MNTRSVTVPTQDAHSALTALVLRSVACICYNNPTSILEITKFHAVCTVSTLVADVIDAVVSSRPTCVVRSWCVDKRHNVESVDVIKERLTGSYRWYSPQRL